MSRASPIPPWGQTRTASCPPRRSGGQSCPSQTETLIWICASCWEGAAPHPARGAPKRDPHEPEVCSLCSLPASAASNFPGQGYAAIAVFCPWSLGLWDTRETPLFLPSPSQHKHFVFLLDYWKKFLNLSEGRKVFSLSPSLSLAPRSVSETQTISSNLLKHFFHLNNTSAGFKGAFAQGSLPRELPSRGHTGVGRGWLFPTPLSPHACSQPRARGTASTLQKCQHLPRLFLETSSQCARSPSKPSHPPFREQLTPQRARMSVLPRALPACCRHPQLRPGEQ